MKSLSTDEDKPTGVHIVQRWNALDILYIFSVEEYELFSPPFRKLITRPVTVFPKTVGLVSLEGTYDSWMESHYFLSLITHDTPR